jgi:hypothetical protein
VAVRYRNAASNRTVPFVAAMLVAGTLVSSTGATASASAASRPAVTAVKTSLGDTGRTAGGATVTVSGTNLTRVISVRFGTNKARDVRASRSGRQLTAITPTHTAGTVNVTVTTAGGTSRAVTADRFTYVPPPTVTGLSARSTASGGGSTITVSGQAFTRVDRVDFGSEAGRSVRTDSTTKLAAGVPAHSAGTVDVRVVTAYGTSAEVRADRLTYVTPPPACADTLAPPTAPTPDPDDGYGFLGVQSDGQPARWDPCNIIYYAVVDDPSVVNQQYFDGGSVNYISDLANVIQQTEAATGLEFQQVTNGSDEPDGSYSDPSLVPSQAVFQVSWVNFQNTSGGVQIEGETSTTFSASYSNGVSHVQAIIGANTKMSYTLTPGFPPEGSNDITDGSVLLHEFGHVVGLQDLCAGGSSCPADATSQIEYVTGNPDSTFQNGDLNGLYLLSSAQGDTGY